MNETVWKWVVGALFSVALAASGYSYRSTDALTSANAARIAALDVDLQQEKVRNALQYREIERRLAELQEGINEIKAQTRQRYR